MTARLLASALSLAGSWYFYRRVRRAQLEATETLRREAATRTWLDHVIQHRQRSKMPAWAERRPI